MKKKGMHCGVFPLPFNLLQCSAKSCVTELEAVSGTG